MSLLPTSGEFVSDTKSDSGNFLERGHFSNSDRDGIINIKMNLMEIGCTADRTSVTITDYVFYFSMQSTTKWFLLLLG
jgi:hypothetical protein